MEKRFLFYSFTLVFITLLFSCEKESYYLEVPEEEIDTTPWDSNYVDGGTLPSGGTNNTNDLIGTTWVITDVQTSFSSQMIHYILLIIMNIQLMGVPLKHTNGV